MADTLLNEEGLVRYLRPLVDKEVEDLKERVIKDAVTSYERELRKRLAGVTLSVLGGHLDVYRRQNRLVVEICEAFDGPKT